MNQTPLMAAASAGNVALTEALLDRGADPEAVDHLGRSALHWALLEAFRDPAYARGPFPALFDRIAPPSLDVVSSGRLVRVDRHQSEYLLFHTLWALFKSRFADDDWRTRAGFQSGAVLDAWQHLPPSVLPPARRQRQHVSAVLARNEVARDYAYNRRLFLRLVQGWYQFNPGLAVRRRSGALETWVPVFEVLNLPFMGETANPHRWRELNQLRQLAGAPALPVPIAGADAAKRIAAREAEEARLLAHWQAEQQRYAYTHPAHPGGLPADVPPPAAGTLPIMTTTPPTPSAVTLPAPTDPAGTSRGATTPALRWGTPEAKRAEVERVRQEIEARRAAREAE